MKPGVMMKSMYAGLFVFCVLAVYAGSAIAQEWQRVEGASKDVEAYILKDTKVLGGVRNVQIKFVNHSDKDIEIAYTAILRCPGEVPRDVDTGKSIIKGHDEDTTSFSYTICPNNTDDNAVIDVRVVQPTENCP